MMAVIGGLIIFGGLIKKLEFVAICGAIIMSAGYIGLVLDNLQRKNAELINNLRK